MSYKKCKFEKMGTKFHQLKIRGKNPKKTEKIAKEKQRRIDEWRKWWS